MSRDWCPKKAIKMKDVFSGVLEPFGVTVGKEVETIVYTDTFLGMPTGVHTTGWLSDGKNSIRLHGSEEGFVTTVSKFGLNSAEKVLTAIHEAFDTDFWTEEDPQFWGYANMAEMTGTSEAQ